jgi:mRNA-degrading endonuclease toxin of MazEF toxin-antitoxin module
MVNNNYIPDRGDIVWLNFNPQTGHEQKGKRPTIVISPKEYNGKVNLGLFCPITSHEKKYPFEVKIKSLDWTKYILDLFDNPVGCRGLKSITVFVVFQAFSLTKPRFLMEVVRKLKFPNNSIDKKNIIV